MLDKILDVVTSVNGHLNNFIWGPIMLVFFLLVGLMFTVRTKVFQISHIKYWLDVTFLSLFKKGNRVGEIFSPLSHHRTCRSAYGGST